MDQREEVDILDGIIRMSKELGKSRLAKSLDEVASERLSEAAQQKTFEEQLHAKMLENLTARQRCKLGME